MDQATFAEPEHDSKKRRTRREVRYGGLAKNTQRIALLLGLSNLLIGGRYAAG